MILAAVNKLVGEHARGRIPAATFLCNLAQRADVLSNKVADMALMPLASVLMENTQGWAQDRHLKVGDLKSNLWY